MRRVWLACLLLAAACDSGGALWPTARILPGVGDPFVLRIGQTAVIDEAGLAVTFVDVPNDSRCPLNAMCVWAGDAEVRLRVRLGPLLGRGPEYDVRLHTIGPWADTIGVYAVRLEELAPGRLAGQPLPEPYYVTLLVERVKQE